MENLGYVIGPIGLVVLIGAVLMLIVPIAASRKHRATARKVAIGAGICFVVGLIITPSPGKVASPSGTSSPASSLSPTAVANEDAQADANATQVAFVDMYRAVLAAVGSCDKSIPEMGRAAGSRDAFTAYRAAQRGEEACGSAAMTINKIEPPSGLTGAAQETTEKALEVCRNSYMARQSAMASAMKAFDGDMRPSVVAEVEDGLKVGQAGVVLCVTSLLDAASKAGVDADRLK